MPANNTDINKCLATESIYAWALSVGGVSAPLMPKNIFFILEESLNSYTTLKLQNI